MDVSAVSLVENHQNRTYSGVLYRNIGDLATSVFGFNWYLNARDSRTTVFFEKLQTEENVDLELWQNYGRTQNELSLANRRHPGASRLEPESVPIEPRHHHPQRLQWRRQFEGA